MTRRTWIQTILLVVAVVATSAPPRGAATTTPRQEAPARSIAWLSIGDSYGAGEGASATTGHCQRSPNAAGPKAATILREERGWTIGPEVFSACTGHLAADLFTSRHELVDAGYTVYDHEIGLLPDSVELSNHDSLYDWAVNQGAPSRRYDVITVSLGGNDIGFADVVFGCTDLVRTLLSGADAVVPSATGSKWEAFARQVAIDRRDAEGCGVLKEELVRRVSAMVDPDNDEEPGFDDGAYGSGQQDPAQRDPLRSLQQMYESLADEMLAPGGVVVVMGYPRLITPSKTWGRWRGGQCNFLRAADADLLGDGAVEFDRILGEAVRGIDDRFEYVSRLDIFDDGENYHSLCGRGVEWLNTPLLFLRDGTLRPQRGFHPNDLGYLATAESVAGVVESRLGESPPPPDTVVSAPGPTTTVTVRSSEPHFDVGDEFDARCTIAWPTAPARGVDSIQMRTFCPSVPDQFLFVDIIYGDPDLDVTPSRSTMQVRGTIVDIIRSEYGYTVLAVEAHEIQLL